MSQIQVAQTAVAYEVLGPGTRAVIYTSGCTKRCEGCLAPEFRDASYGKTWSAQSLAKWMKHYKEITISGGEPLLQASALVPIVRTAKINGAGIILFTGYEQHEAHYKGEGVMKLWNLADLVISGPYEQSLAGDYYLRGSSNQRLNFNSDRYTDYFQKRGDRSVGVQVSISAKKAISFLGVPPVRNFIPTLEEFLSRKGISL